MLGPQNKQATLLCCPRAERPHSWKHRQYALPNNNPPHLAELVAIKEGEEEQLELPHVNQFELHPLIYPFQRPLLDFCAANDIFVQAYSSLGEGNLIPPPPPQSLDTSPTISTTIPETPTPATRVSITHLHTLLTTLAHNHTPSPTPAQLLLAWALVHSWGVIPKSTSLARMRENLGAVDVALDWEDVQVLDGVVGEEGVVKFCWDPSRIR
ncbi:NADP-dependent oxidoreductase domain-containing protein [Fimicolochytrium jonesii]|uniref:NADP-dependent oxidoreductase domain-containing protein n=1 Tax=Fimicolochytrium jonesii TaxID=1396493 RepID=UPI0022FDCBF0|nr:NADP-dependent oxidoreductase domain-containing protein [Fimicolochytrium jonesii]KAI8821043.1 NADP-dependent oxidoreductase domain-containing protein [Fimicolochytrium jonesii]